MFHRVPFLASPKSNHRDQGALADSVRSGVLFRQADPRPHPRARLLRRVSAYCRFGRLTALDKQPHVGASESQALRRRSVTQDGLDRDGIPVHVVLPPVRGAALGGSSACLAACFGSCVHKRVAIQAHIPSAVAEAPGCAATRPTGSITLPTKREGRIPGSMKRHGWDGWIGVRYPDRAIPTKPSCHSWRTTPNYISSTGSRGALGRQGSMCYGRFATGEDSWACTEFGLCEQPSSPHIMLPPRESCFATLPLTAYPKFRCIQGSCASVPNIFARATPFVRGRSTNLGFARLQSAPNQAKQA